MHKKIFKTRKFISQRKVILSVPLENFSKIQKFLPRQQQVLKIRKYLILR